MPDVKPSVLVNAVMSKLYDVLTNGDETVPKSEDNFFSWCTPGIPMEPSDFQFLTQGLTGVVKKRALQDLTQPGAAPPGGGAAQPAQVELTPALLEQLRASDAAKMYMQAEGLARLVDFVPDVTKVHNEQFARLNVLNNEGTLSDIYAMTLRMSQVMHQELDAGTKAKIEEFRGLLNVTTKQKDIITNAETEVSEPSPLVLAYNDKMQAYMSAALDYNSHRIDALVADNSRAVHDWAINANIYREKVRAARRDWETRGYKTQYEKIAAFIEQVQARDMALLKADYQDALQKATLTGLASGSDFYYTSLVPGSFATSRGWARFSFASGDFNARSNSSYSASRWSASGGGSFFGIFGGSASHRHSESRTEYHGSFSSDRFDLSFEICQVPIVRPWFKTPFLTSKSWRFDPGSPDVRGKGLSDGGAPPKGIMPAYPTTAVFIRNLNLTIGHSEGFTDFIAQHRSSATSGGGFVAFGPVLLGGSAGNASSSGSTQRDWGYKYDNQGMQVAGMQLVGFKCHIVPKTPDPDPSITAWI
jgi:hypothetical protein